MQSYKCPKCNKEFTTSEEVVNDIAFHADTVPANIKLSWFEGNDPLRNSKILRITEVV